MVDSFVCVLPLVWSSHCEQNSISQFNQFCRSFSSKKIHYFRSEPFRPGNGFQDHTKPHKTVQNQTWLRFRYPGSTKFWASGESNRQIVSSLFQNRPECHGFQTPERGVENVKTEQSLLPTSASNCVPNHSKLKNFNLKFARLGTIRTAKITALVLKICRQLLSIISQCKWKKWKKTREKFSTIRID